MFLHGIQKVCHGPALPAADDLWQTGSRCKQIGLRQAVQCATCFQCVQKILCEVRARKRFVRVDPCVQLFQKSLTGVLRERQAVYKQEVGTVAIEQIHEKLLIGLFPVLRLTIDKFNLIFRVQRCEIAGSHGENAAAAARNADQALFREIALRRGQPDQTVLRRFVLRRVELQAEILPVPHAAEGFDIHGVQADRIAGKQLCDSVLRDLPAEAGVIGKNEAVIRRIFARIERFGSGTEQSRQLAERLDFFIRYGIKRLFVLRPTQKRTVPHMEEAFDLRSRLLPEKRSVHGAGENAGTVCGK